MKQLSVHLIMKLDKNKQNRDNHYQPEISWLQKFCVTILLKEKIKSQK